MKQKPLVRGVFVMLIYAFFSVVFGPEVPFGILNIE